MKKHRERRCQVFRPSRRKWGLLGASLATALLIGCADADAPLRAARNAIAAGDYATAHQKLLAAGDDPKLSDPQRGEVAGDLCLTEFKLGAPAYPFAEQLDVCRKAASSGLRPSTTVLVEVAAAQRAAETSNVNQAIAHDDLAGAEVAIARYQALPGADPHTISQWSNELWSIVGHEDDSAANSRRYGLQPAISRASREFPQVRAMNKPAFARWVERNLRVDGTSLVSGVTVAKHTLTLHIPDKQMPTAATNLDRFIEVNDAMVARCGCDGQTNVALQESELPAYLVRLDPATSRSEVLVLTQY